MFRVLVPPKIVGETRTDYIDFAPLLVAGQTITSATVVASLYSGVDASPGSVAVSATVSGLTVAVKTTGGVLGAIYQLVVTAVTASPAGTVPATFYLAVVSDLP